MPEPNRSLIASAEEWVVSIFHEKIGKDFLFHSLAHTREVVWHSEQLAGHYELSPEEHSVLLIAAWFHDTGYSMGPAQMHEEESQRIATEFLRRHHASEAFMLKVNSCIIATRMPQSPTTLIEQIICDADLFHLGTANFPEKNKLLRKEINLLQKEKLGKKEWRMLNLEFLERHRYFTEYARETLEPVKQQHIQRLLKKEGVEELIITSEEQQGAAVNSADPEELNSKKPKEARNDRGVVAMFRIMSESHINLSQMADSKANIMISVNTIVLSILVSVLLGKLQFYPEFIVPTILLVCACLSAIVFAILATRPNISQGTFTREDIKNKQVNLLFFGNFYNMQLPDYDWAMKELMKDKEYLYSSMIKDIYFLGLVLARKYKFLRVSYNIFMFGLVAAILAFVAAFIFSGSQG